MRVIAFPDNYKAHKTDVVCRFVSTESSMMRTTELLDLCMLSGVDLEHLVVDTTGEIENYDLVCAIGEFDVPESVLTYMKEKYPMTWEGRIIRAENAVGAMKAIVMEYTWATEDLY